jgi:hypothetical protein
LVTEAAEQEEVTTEQESLPQTMVVQLRAMHLLIVEGVVLMTRLQVLAVLADRASS